MTPEDYGNKFFEKFALHDTGAGIVRMHEWVVSTIKQAEAAAYEKAARVAENKWVDFAKETDGLIVTAQQFAASTIAAAIRALAEEKGGEDE